MLILSLTFAALVADTHNAENAVYRLLVEDGVKTDAQSVKLPAPSMKDGLDAAGQRAVIDSLIGESYRFDSFTSKTPVAPQIIKLSERETTEGETPLRRLDIWFVAFGGLDQLEDSKLLGELIDDDSQNGSGRDLSAAELSQRKITKADNESYGYGTFNVLKKVELSAAGRTCWSKTADSIVSATIIDSRFDGDAEFANVWRSLLMQDDGSLKPRDAEPYAGAGLYVKITRLAEPSGALFFEAHVVYAEPHGWFNGANLLGSKLPAVVQNEVRALRRRLLRGS